MVVLVASPRHIVNRKALKDIAFRHDASSPNSSTSDPPLAKPGEMQLYSFYAPSPEAGTYATKSGQTIYLPGPDTIITPPTKTDPNPEPNTDAELFNATDQQFKVVAPQFVVDPKDIHSCYPPQDHGDQSYILPHIVFNDPHLPWDRPAVTSQVAEAMPDFLQNRIPWIALLSFDPNGTDQELRVDPAILSSILPADVINGIKPGTQLQKANTLSVTMNVSQYMGLGDSGKVTTPDFTAPNAWHRRDASKPVDVIFINGKQFTAFFTSPADPTKIDLSRYRFLSHVRNINTIGMPQSGVEDQGLFSVIVSHRSGPTDIKPGLPPRTQMVHLVSLENINLIKKIPQPNDLVALISLASWSYQCLPPLGVNFVDSMYDIGLQVKNESCLLRLSDATLSGLFKNFGSDAMMAAVGRRLSLGYSLIRHRLATGEETVAFSRGPLLPIGPTLPKDAYSDHPLGKNWLKSSNFGQEYQLLDPDLGIIDISYSTAWQLGKTLAMADGSFADALMRVRGHVHSRAVAATNSKIVAKTDVENKEAFYTNHSHTFDKMANLAANEHGDAGIDPARRCKLPSVVAGEGRTAVASISNVPAQHMQFLKTIRTELNNVGSIADHRGKSYNDLSPPSTTDWALIHAWVMDKLYLSSIPRQYFITNVTHLPAETIRFFHIDQTWMDCFIDGALSIGNPLLHTDDDVRRGIKEQLNDYFQTELVEGTLGHYPQVPSFGFLLRSKVVECFPDLRIEVPFVDDNIGNMRASVLSLRLLGKDILLCLLDRIPDSGELLEIKISQPEHQQCFSAGYFLNDQTVEFKFRKIPPALVGADTPGPADPSKPTGQFGGATGIGNAGMTPATKTMIPEKEFGQFDSIMYPPEHQTADPVTGIYNWKTRCLNLDTFNSELFKKLRDPIANNPEFADWVQGGSTSALVGLELNLPQYHLSLSQAQSTAALSASPKATDLKGIPRVIWVGPPALPPAKTSSNNPTNTTGGNPSALKTLAESFPPPNPPPKSPPPANLDTSSLKNPQRR